MGAAGAVHVDASVFAGEILGVYVAVEFGFFAAAEHEVYPGFAVGFAVNVAGLVVDDVAGFMDDGVALFGFVNAGPEREGETDLSFVAVGIGNASREEG